MKADWVRWSGQFAARPVREKRVLAVAAIAVIYALVDAVWFSPALTQWKTDTRLLAQKRADLARTTAQHAQLAEQMRSQDAQTKSAIASAQKDLDAVSARLLEMEKQLVPARRMADLLQGLLPGRGVEVVAVKTLPPTPLLANPPAKVSEPAKAGSATPAQTPAMRSDNSSKSTNLYRHGIEISLAGSYPALVDYLERLEKSPQKVIFAKMELKAEQYPRSILTLTLYTLSLDKSWLIV